jgi:phosphoribosylanthranilate isomerase
MMVKVCGITRREDAIAAAEAGASALGFIFYPKSPRYVTPEKARRLGDGLDLAKVGVFVDESSAFIDEVMLDAKLDVAQVYGKAVVPKNGRLWLAVRVESGLGAFAGPAREAVLLDGAANGISFDWQLAKSLGEHEKLIIAGGLNSSNVAHAIRVAQPWGVDASSSLESSPGIKDHEKMRQFVKAAQEAAL